MRYVGIRYYGQVKREYLKKKLNNLLRLSLFKHLSSRVCVSSLWQSFLHFSHHLSHATKQKKICFLCEIRTVNKIVQMASVQKKMGDDFSALFLMTLSRLLQIIMIVVFITVIYCVCVTWWFGMTKIKVRTRIHCRNQ